jgi:hypothetical protein
VNGRENRFGATVEIGRRIKQAIRDEVPLYARLIQSYVIPVESIHSLQDKFVAAWGDRLTIVMQKKSDLNWPVAGCRCLDTEAEEPGSTIEQRLTRRNRKVDGLAWPDVASHEDEDCGRRNRGLRLPGAKRLRYKEGSVAGVEVLGVFSHRL